MEPVKGKLIDGREVTVREPHPERDLEALVQFYGQLPPEVKQMLRYDVDDRAMVAARLKQIDGQNHWRLIAEHQGRIVAEAAVDRDPYGWTRHVAEVRMVVDPSIEYKGVRQLFVEHIIAVARQAGIERLTAEVLADHEKAIDILKGLGFCVELTRTNYAKGLDGRLHDVVVLSNDLEAVWRQLEEYLASMDHYFPGLAGRQ